MATKFYKVFVRTSADVEFPTDDKEFIEYITNTYISTGQCLEFRVPQEMPDELTMIVVSTWANDQTLDLALLDPVWDINTKQTQEYADSHNIFVYSWTE